jgi:long-chain acyl-CoA synthetase
MQEYTSPGEVAVAADANLTRVVWETARSAPDRPTLAERQGDRFVDWSARRFADEVLALAKGLVALGVEPGQRVCLYSSTRLEWTLLDYAVWAAGAVTVPIYETSSAEQVEWIVSDSDAVAILIETPELEATWSQVATRLPACAHALVLEAGALDQLRVAGAEVGEEVVRARADAVGPDDLATIVYTSGTTGRPKGCLLTHGNFVWTMSQAQSVLPEVFRPGGRTLLFLPLAHIYARVIQTMCVTTGVTLAFSSGIPQLPEELRIYQPPFVLAVPRVFEKIYNGARQKAQAEGKASIFDRAVDVAERYSRQQAAGRPSVGTRLQHAVFDRLVYGKLRTAMGGQLTYAMSGGAALGERLGHVFHGMGVTILEGYGLTETTAPHTASQPGALRIGTVGRPLPGASVRIADDGEVLLKGGNIFRGYHHAPEATAEVLTGDGWFHSGDIGALDDAGYLRITGRKKEIIVTAGGKNVAPAVLEDRLRGHALVSQSMVVGEKQPFVAALVAIDPEAFALWAPANGAAGATVADLIDDPRLHAEVQRAVDDANRAVSKAESIRTFRILPEDFVVGEELSQKLSVKRYVVAEKYADVIDDIYAGADR